MLLKFLIFIDIISDLKKKKKNDRSFRFVYSVVLNLHEKQTNVTKRTSAAGSGNGHVCLAKTYTYN